VARAPGRVEAFSRWLTVFGDAWEQDDSAALSSLFTVGATLAPDPFADLVRGRRSVLAWFGERFADLPGATFSAQVLGAGDTYGVAHWRVTSMDRALDGVMVVALDPRGRCESLRQWWHESAV
jgi:hypothetical protein